MLLLALLAATATPSDDDVRDQAMRCGLEFDHLVWNVDTAGNRKLDHDGELPTPSAKSVQCMVKWAKQNGVSVGFASQPRQAKPTTARKVIGAGVYLCTVSAKAGIGSIHIEGSGPPEAFAVNRAATRFKMRITRNRSRTKPFRMVEIAYDGSDRDQAEWEDENSVLHSAYLGNGTDFYAVDDPAFITLYRINPGHADGNIAFYHSGFEHPGGEDENLAVRWGRCRKVE